MIYDIPIYLLLIASLICLIRVVKGPTIPDRVLAADAFVSISISMIVMFSLETSDFLMDVAIIYAILGFTGTVAISKYLEGKKLGE